MLRVECYDCLYRDADIRGVFCSITGGDPDFEIDAKTDLCVEFAPAPGADAYIERG